MSGGHDPTLSGLAHALASPLFLVRGHAALLSDRLAADREEHEHVEAIRRGADQMRALLDGILLLAQATAAPAPERVDLGAAAAARVAKLRAAGVDVQAGPFAPVRADPAHVGLLLDQLLDNARRHGAGAPVRVWSEPADRGRVRVCVRDDGPGFETDRVALALAPFRRLGGDGSEDRRSGVGLSACVAVCAAAGGELVLTTARGAGTEVCALLPAADDEGENSDSAQD